ncbi:MAG TPA: sortase [Jatrophihabitans sp.]|nr:sortase [Jatrophihabitans sp.]
MRAAPRRLAAAIVAGAGAGLLIAAVVNLRPERSVPAPFGVTAPTSAAATSTMPTPPGPATHTSSVPAIQPSTPPAAPVTLSIPTLGVRASVLPVVNDHGMLGVPDDPAQVGWWSASALAGAATGTVVLDGHVDSATSGPGALFRLASLQANDPITLTTRTGQLRRYTVTGRRVYVKAGGLPADIFAQDGPARLVLISCGGPFDRTAGSYLDNIVEFAVPA